MRATKGMAAAESGTMAAATPSDVPTRARVADHEHDQDDERNGAADVDQPARDTVEHAMRMQADRSRKHEQNAQRNAERVRERGRKHGHHDAVERALRHKRAVINRKTIDRVHLHRLLRASRGGGERTMGTDNIVGFDQKTGRLASRSDEHASTPASTRRPRSMTATLLHT